MLRCFGLKMHKKPEVKRTCNFLKDWLDGAFESRCIASCSISTTTSSPNCRRRCSKTTDSCRRKHKNIGELMLAQKWTGGVNPEGWWISEKLDGVRAYWDGKAFYSRRGNEFIAPSWFTEGLPADMELDGELFGGRGKFQLTHSVVKTRRRSDNMKNITFQVFDTLGHSPFEERLAACKKHFDKNEAPYATVLPHQKCMGVDHMYEEHRRIESVGGEGIMLREPGSKYIRGRSKSLLKLKSYRDAEAVVVGYKPSKKNSTLIGSLECKMANGLLFNLGWGLSYEERRCPPKIGSIIIYRFQGYTNSGCPRFAKHIRVLSIPTEPTDAVVSQ